MVGALFNQYGDFGTDPGECMAFVFATGFSIDSTKSRRSVQILSEPIKRVSSESRLRIVHLGSEMAPRTSPDHSKVPSRRRAREGTLFAFEAE